MLSYGNMNIVPHEHIYKPTRVNTKKYVQDTVAPETNLNITSIY